VQGDVGSHQGVERQHLVHVARLTGGHEQVVEVELEDDLRVQPRPGGEERKDVEGEDGARGGNDLIRDADGKELPPGRSDRPRRTLRQGGDLAPYGFQGVLVRGGAAMGVGIVLHRHRQGRRAGPVDGHGAGGVAAQAEGARDAPAVGGGGVAGDVAGQASGAVAHGDGGGGGGSAGVVAVQSVGVEIDAARADARAVDVQTTVAAAVGVQAGGIVDGIGARMMEVDVAPDFHHAVRLHQRDVAPSVAGDGGTHRPAVQGGGVVGAQHVGEHVDDPIGGAGDVHRGAARGVSRELDGHDARGAPAIGGGGVAGQVAGDLGGGVAAGDLVRRRAHLALGDVVRLDGAHVHVQGVHLLLEPERSVGQLLRLQVGDAVRAAHHRIGRLELIDAGLPSRAFDEIGHQATP